MTPKQEAKLKKLGIFTRSQAEAIGLKGPAITRLVQKEQLSRVGHGIYSHPKALVTREIDFQIALLKFGSDSAVGGLSALFYYNLIEQVPTQTWVIVPPKTRTYEKQYRLMRTKSDPTLGVIAKNGYRITSVERTLVEALKFSSKIGERTAIGAIRKALKERMTTLKKIGLAAKELGLDSTLTRFFEAIVA